MEISAAEIDEVIMDLARMHPDYTTDQFINEFRSTVDRDPTFAEKRTFQKYVVDCKSAGSSTSGAPPPPNHPLMQSMSGGPPPPPNHPLMQSMSGGPPPPPNHPLMSGGPRPPSNPYASGPPPPANPSANANAYRKEAPPPPPPQPQASAAQQTNTQAKKGGKGKAPVIQIGDPSNFQQVIGMSNTGDEEMHPGILDILRQNDVTKQDVMADMEATRFLLEISYKHAGQTTIPAAAQKRFTSIVQRMKTKKAKGGKTTPAVVTYGYPPEYGGEGGISLKMVSEYPLFQATNTYEPTESSDIPLYEGYEYYFLEYYKGQRGWGLFCLKDAEQAEYLSTRTFDTLRNDTAQGYNVPKFGVAPTNYLVPLQ